MKHTGLGDVIREIRLELSEFITHLQHTLLNPEHFFGAPHLLDRKWNTMSLGAFLYFAAAVSGALAGISSLSPMNFILGILVYPFSTLVKAFVIGLMILSYQYLRYGVHAHPRDMAHSIVLAELPSLFVHIFSGLINAADHLGSAVFCVLMGIRLQRAFQMPKLESYGVMFGIYSLLVIFYWLISQSGQHIN